MVSNAESFAPYAPARNVLEVIHRKRDRGLPEVINGQVLQQIGIPAGNVSRTLRALLFLGLVRDDGRQTEALERLANASTGTYRSTLAEVMQAAYQNVFTVIDPSQDEESAIADAFRQYEPRAQRDRMVILFMSLCREAGLAPEPRRVNSVGGRQGRPRVLALKAPAKAKPAAEALESIPDLLPRALNVDYRIISAIMQQLPANGKWTKSKRERWLSAITAAVDLMVETID